MKNLKPFIPFVLSLLLLVSLSAQAADQPINAVLASVNGKPITLNDLQKRAKDSQAIKLADLASQTDLRQLLDRMILEKLVEEDAKQRQLAVNTTDIDGYISDIAAQNGLSIDDFKKELNKEKIDFNDYKSRVRIDILKSKLASVLFREGTSVSDEDVESYLKKHGDLNKSGAKVKLRQLVVAKNNKKPEELKRILSEIEAKLKDDKDDFSKLVAEYSESPDRTQDGVIGVIAMTDLSPIIQDAIILLNSGETSERVENDGKVYYFNVEEKFSADVVNVKDDVRRMLENQKLQEKLGRYFALDIYKRHSVEKKI